MMTFVIVGLVLVAIVGWGMTFTVTVVFARAMKKEQDDWHAIHLKGMEAVDKIQHCSDAYKRMLDEEERRGENARRMIAFLAHRFGPFQFQKPEVDKFEGDFTCAIADGAVWIRPAPKMAVVNVGD